MITLDEQIAEFASLGTVFDPSASEEALAVELAEVLMRQPLAAGPLEGIGRLNTLLRILRLVTRIVTARRDHQAYAVSAFWSLRRLAEIVGVTRSTMQGWCAAGAKARLTADEVAAVVETQDVSRETAQAA